MLRACFRVVFRGVHGNDVVLDWSVVHDAPRSEHYFLKREITVKQPSQGHVALDSMISRLSSRSSILRHLGGSRIFSRESKRGQTAGCRNDCSGGPAKESRPAPMPSAGKFRSGHSGTLTDQQAKDRMK